MVTNCADPVFPGDRDTQEAMGTLRLLILCFPLAQSSRWGRDDDKEELGVERARGVSCLAWPHQEKQLKGEGGALDKGLGPRLSSGPPKVFGSLWFAIPTPGWREKVPRPDASQTGTVRGSV